MISTRDLSLLPDVPQLRRLLQSLAMLDALLSPEWEYRYYSFNAAWAPGAQMGSMRDGTGDGFFAHFGGAGCWLKGFAHESPMSPYREDPPRPWPGVLDRVPTEFAACLAEPAFSVADVTFCIWRRTADESWHIGQLAFPGDHPDPDGSAGLLSALDGRAETYREFAETYFEVNVAHEAIRRVYEHQPLTEKLVARFAEREVDEQLLEDVREIGYPSALEE